MEIGENITWTRVSRRGRLLSMSLRCGTIEVIDGDMVTVRRPNGKREKIKLERIRRKGEKSQITEFIEVVREVNASVTKEDQK